MTRPIKRLDVVRQEIGAVLKLSPVVLAVLLLAVFLWRTDSAANSGLFQSVPSPLDTPTPGPATPTVLASPTSVPASVTPGTPQPTAPLPSVTPTSPLTSTVEPTASLTPTVTTTPATPTPAAGSGTAEPTPDDRQRYADEDSNLAFDLSMLLDAMAFFLARIWLCCGVLVFVAIPIVFIVLWVASKRRRQREG